MLSVSGLNLSSVQDFNHSHGVLPYSLYSCVNFFFISSYDVNFVNVNQCLAKSRSVIRKYSCISLKSFSGSSFCLSTKSSKLCKCVRVFVLSLPSNVACGKNTALSLNEGILSGEESGDEVGVLFLCGVGGEGGGEPHAPVSLCTAVAIACGIGMGWDFVVDFVVCDVVGLSVLDILEVSVGTDMGCFCLRLCIS